MSDTRSPIIELSTQVKQPAMFTIDGEEYDLLSLDHLSAVQEAEVMALFSKHTRITAALETETNHEKAKALALRMRRLRIEVLSIMTTADASVLGKLPMTAQGTLMNGIKEEMESGSMPAVDEDENEEDEGDDDDI